MIEECLSFDDCVLARIVSTNLLDSSSMVAVSSFAFEFKL